MGAVPEGVPTVCPPGGDLELTHAVARLDDDRHVTVEVRFVAAGAHDPDMNRGGAIASESIEVLDEVCAREVHDRTDLLRSEVA